jgi:hypothetical protein
MRRHVLCNAVFAALISAVSAFGCEEDTQDDKIVLSAVIPDPVPVDLGFVNGTMIFDFQAHPLDLGQKFELEKVLFQGDFVVTVMDDATGVTFDLTQGTALMTPPEKAGDYLVSVSEDGRTVTIEFYNFFQGSDFNPGGDYSVTVDVLDNAFFATETFARDVTMN